MFETIHNTVWRSGGDVIKVVKDSPKSKQLHLREIQMYNKITNAERICANVAMPRTMNNDQLTLPFYGDDAFTMLHNKRLNRNMVIHLMKDVVRAINFIHEECQISHNDIKLENVVWSSEIQQWILIDFGLGMEIDEPVNPKHFMGTMPYIIPRIAGKKYHQKMNDYYAFSMMILEICYPELMQKLDKMTWRVRLDKILEIFKSKHSPTQIKLCCQIVMHLNDMKYNILYWHLTSSKHFYTYEDESKEIYSANPMSSSDLWKILTNLVQTLYVN